MSIAEWRHQLKHGKVSARELVDEQLSRIEEVDEHLNAFLEVTSSRARACQYCTTKKPCMGCI